METLPRVGERVIAPWGLDEVEGEVIRAYGKGDHASVTLEILLYGSDEPMIVTFQLRAIRRLAAT